MKLLKNLFFVLVIFITYSFNCVVYADSTLDCNQYLSYYNRGNQVRILQKRLNETIGCNLEVDGIFGSKTNQCVRKFQKEYNLAVDGIVGPKTCSKLNSLTNVSNSNNSSTSNDSYVVVSASRLNVRAKATKYSKVLDIVDNGTIFKIYGSKNSNGTTWYKIKINDKYGYICGDYAKKNAIVLDISEQNLKLYKNGVVILDAPVVTGNAGNHDTPTGHYKLSVVNMEKARYLKGYNDDGSKYNAYVDYWMPFITSRGIGFHDASWRSASEFNTETYLYNGSHGCVNMQKEDASFLYNEVTSDIDVFVIE